MQLKVHHVLIVTNLLTLATLAYVGIKPASVSDTSSSQVANNDLLESSHFERRHMAMAVSGYHDVASYRHEDGKVFPDRDETLKIRKGDPFIFIAWEAWMPKATAPEGFGLQPEFMFPHPGAGWDEQDTIDYYGDLWLADGGKLGVFTARTDTVDMHGQSKKRLQFTPIMRYPVGDEIVEFRDTVEVWVIDNE